ncbi:MAG: glycosyltransferase family 4 protein [Polyangiales bacterium]|nr:glycosyltransferase family 4 protein [Myxococcales bacterium]MCB9657925.1 glycosyltransferase family 4 protein [Sandaracinaceae bacterium]
MSTDRAPAVLRSLHVACMPFPTPQGTQAIVAMMVRALREAGHDAALLTYAHGVATPGAPEPERLSDWPRVRATRSGPSLGKVALDLRMVAAVRRRLRRAPVDVVVAHNVEAAWACAGVGDVPVVYYAHTSMREELPHYARATYKRSARALGALLDRGACAGSAAVFALTPVLTERYAPLHAHVRCVPPPFERPPGAPPDRARARSILGLGRGDVVALYAGNLDAYQGLSVLLHALRQRGAWTCLVATDSDPTPLRAEAVRLGVAARIRWAPLATERDRAVVHAAADVALVPRRAPGGLPIKLLDALARGVPVVAGARALAGLPLTAAVTVVPDDDPAALAEAVVRVASGPAAANASEGGQHALDRAGLTPDDFATRFQQACANVVRVAPG